MQDPDDGEMAYSASELRTRSALTTLHYAFPIAVFVYYVISSTIAVCTLQTRKASERGNDRRRAIIWLLFFAILTYLVQLLFLVARPFLCHEDSPEQDTIIGLLSCILVFGVEFAGLSDSTNLVWHPYTGSFGLALVFEPAIAALSLLARPSQTFTYFDIVNFSTVASRYLAFVLSLALYVQTTCITTRERSNDTERQSLLKTNRHANPEDSDDQTDASEQNGYGSTSDASTDASQTTATEEAETPWQKRERKASEQMEKRLREKGNWVTYAKSFLVFLPYVWPVNNRPLQIRVVLVGVCLLAMNIVNVLIPRQLGIVMDSLGEQNELNPWVQVLIFAGLKLIASEAGLSLLRQWLWIPVEFYSLDSISTAAFSHVLNLSSDFHDSKSSSDIMVAIQTGSSISNMLEQICFQAIPMLIDMTVAFIYLSVTFGPYEGFITIATAAIFMYTATRMITKLKEARRGQVSAWYDEHYVRQAGIQGWRTVASFNQIGHEEQRYSAVSKNRVDKSQKVWLGYTLAHAFQVLVLLSGLLAGAFLAVYQVSHKQATPGQFIMLLTYWSQLVAPLTFFATLGKNISKDLIEAEQLLEIMQTKPTVVSKEKAPPLQFKGGHVRFNSVSFSYNSKKQILKNVDFEATPGETIAFVGATGAGKSTILKLLDRFYDVTEGSIEIDDQDIRDIDLFSLRAQIGVVPQDPILFDDTIMNNVRYAKLSATDEEVYEACKAASIHEQILTFADGYQTRVGERGTKLSGGELQRVAIARAILKRPAIVLLDEATSAVDTETEQRIQEALQTLCKGRTTFIVAHRLSTIMNADHIIVVTGGELVEQGSHEELIRANGKYADLWSKQIFVKPKDKESTKKTEPRKGRKNANIFNDLSLEITNSELAKVQNTPTRQADGAEGHSSSSEDSSDTDQALGHKKEGSRLNPDAPAFTPRSLAAAFSATATSPVRPDATSGRYYPRTAMSPLHPSTGNRLQYFATPFVMVPTPYPMFHPLPPSAKVAEPVLTAEKGIAEVNNDQEISESISERDKQKKGAREGLRSPCYSRRVQSKSEPLAPGSNSSSP